MWDKESYRSGQHSLSRAELDRVLECAESFEHVVLLKLAVAAGLRRGDIVCLKWADFDPEKRSLTFYERKKRRNRTVYLPESLCHELLRLRRMQDGGLYIFPGRSEKKYGRGHLSDRHAYNIFQSALQRAGLSPRPFHALRATCIKLAQEAGWSLTQTAEHVGDTVHVVERHYLAPSDGEMREVSLHKPIVR